MRCARSQAGVALWLLVLAAAVALPATPQTADDQRSLAGEHIKIMAMTESIVAIWVTTLR
jgi:hypothetical protein